jgi:hypothetical protein
MKHFPLGSSKLLILVVPPHGQVNFSNPNIIRYLNELKPQKAVPKAVQRHAAKIGRRVMSELKRLEKQIVDAGLMPDD